MAITEEGRHRMYQRLEEVLGAELATTLMEHLPPVGWADVATKRDLDHNAAATKHDMAQLSLQLRGEMSELGAQLRGEMSELRVELHRELRRQTYAMLGGGAALATVAVAFSHLL